MDIMLDGHETRGIVIVGYRTKKVGSNSPGITQGLIIVLWTHETSSDAGNVAGQIKVIRGHPRSNRLLLLYKHDTLWV